VHHLITTMGLSERFACRVVGQHRATQRREPPATTPGDPDTALRAWLRDWAKAHPRRGFRNAYADARGEGWMNRPGVSGDSVPWKGWGHVSKYIEEVSGRAA
jgi:hypothetical protein